MFSIELSDIDLRYEEFRVKNASRERILLKSILEKGILEPVNGVKLKDGKYILLDGFKRYRCAVKAKINILNFLVLADDEAGGLISLIRAANARTLTILEQARLVDELKNVYNLSVNEIAQRVERSVGWVGMRLGILDEMPKTIKDKIFSDKFPAYSYLYTLRQFMRMKNVKKKECEEFVNAVSGKGISTREIDILARGYFQGSDKLREQIKAGNLSWSLNELKELAKASNKREGLTEIEVKLLNELTIIQKYITRVSYLIKDSRITSEVFAEANLLSGGILSRIKPFIAILESFYDRTRQA